jgi:hypothetical protein
VTGFEPADTSLGSEYFAFLDELRDSDAVNTVLATGVGGVLPLFRVGWNLPPVRISR